MTARPDARILCCLRGAGAHLPPEELAGLTGLLVSELRESVARLQAAGFEIEQHPMLGFRLHACPDRLMADDLWSRLGEMSDFLKEILVLEETASTNDVAARLGAEGKSALLVCAERQTAGRGRFGRSWASAAGRGLWLSLLLRPALPLEMWPRLTTWAAYAVAEVLGPRAKIKWPNDVQIDGRKVAGILIEASGPPQPFAVIGIGVNINQTAEDFPPELDGLATSLRLTTGHAWDRADLLVALLRQLHATSRLLDESFSTLVREVEARSSLIGRDVQAVTGGRVVEGRAAGLDEEGRLVLQLQNGDLIPLTAGEVTLRMD